MNLHNLFTTVVQATVFGSVVGIIIFILKSTLLRKLPARWQYLLWSVMIIKLIYPTGPESEISIFNKIKVLKTFNEADILSFSQKPYLLNVSEKTAKLYNVSEIIPYIWITGLILTTLWIIFSYIILKHNIYTSSSVASENTISILNKCKNTVGIKKNIKIVVQKHIPTASLHGAIYPKILITEDFEKNDINHLEHTFMHELSHYKRGDVLANYFLLFLQCIHWFNPVIWFLFKKIRQDIELATDELTMLHIQPDEHKSYGMALINTLCLHTTKAPKLLGMSNNKNDIKKRIKAISKFKKPNFAHNVSGIMALILISTICLTSAVAAKPISDAIYNNIPKFGISLIDNGTFKFGQHINDKEKTIPNETEVIKEQKPVVEENKHNEFENPENSIVVEGLNKTIDLDKYATTVNYNTDYNGKHTIRVKPNSTGYIQFYIENDTHYNHLVKIGISNIETNGYGWDYQFTTEGKTPIYLDGYNPDEEYFVTIDCYCPGHYNINGTILIY